MYHLAQPQLCLLPHCLYCYTTKQLVGLESTSHAWSLFLRISLYFSDISKIWEKYGQYKSFCELQCNIMYVWKSSGWLNINPIVYCVFTILLTNRTIRKFTKDHLLLLQKYYIYIKCRIQDKLTTSISYKNTFLSYSPLQNHQYYINIITKPSKHVWHRESRNTTFCALNKLVQKQKLE